MTRIAIGGPEPPIVFVSDHCPRRIKVAHWVIAIAGIILGIATIYYGHLHETMGQPHFVRVTRLS